MTFLHPTLQFRPILTKYLNDKLTAGIFLRERNYSFLKD